MTSLEEDLEEIRLQPQGPPVPRHIQEMQHVNPFKVSSDNDAKLWRQAANYVGAEIRFSCKGHSKISKLLPGETRYQVEKILLPELDIVA